jgi:integrase
LIVTGCRLREISALKWKWVDLDRGFLRLPDSKTGAKVVPLAAAALQLLANLPRESEWVFPSDRGTGPVIAIQKSWDMVRVWCGLEEVRLHDLRHSFASFAAADGSSLFLIGKVLGHTQARTTEKYAHLSDDPVRAVANKAASRIAAAMRTGTGHGAQVVDLTKKRT